MHLARQGFQGFKPRDQSRRVCSAPALAFHLSVKPHEGLQPDARKRLLLQARVLDNRCGKYPSGLTGRILPQEHGPQGIAAVAVDPAPHLAIRAAHFAGDGPSAGRCPVKGVAP